MIILGAFTLLHNILASILCMLWIGLLVPQWIFEHLVKSGVFALHSMIGFGFVEHDDTVKCLQTRKPCIKSTNSWSAKIAYFTSTKLSSYHLCISFLNGDKNTWKKKLTSTAVQALHSQSTQTLKMLIILSRWIRKLQMIMCIKPET